MIRQVLPEPSVVDGPEALEAFYAHPEGRHLRADFVVSLDGAVEIGGRSKPLGAPADRDAFMAMRAVADAVMVGAGTVRGEHYGPVALPEDAISRRALREQSPLPPLVIVSRRGLFGLEAKVFTGPGRPILLTTSAVLSDRPDLKDVAEVIECGEEEVDLRDGIECLSRLGLNRIVCEGGPSLLRTLLAGDLVDELCLTISPVIAGPQHLHLSGTTPLQDPARFRLQSLLEGDGLLFGRYASTGNGP